MLNEMGAFMSLAREDPLPPMDGLAEGFEQWKLKQADELMSPRRSPRKLGKTKSL